MSCKWLGGELPFKAEHKSYNFHENSEWGETAANEEAMSEQSTIKVILALALVSLLLSYLTTFHFAPNGLKRYFIIKFIFLPQFSANVLSVGAPLLTPLVIFALPREYNKKFRRVCVAMG